MIDSLMLETLDFTTAYFGVLLGQCAMISFFLFRPLFFFMFMKLPHTVFERLVREAGIWLH